MKREAFFIDFDDSFSYNVVQELERAGINTEVVNWSDVEELPVDRLLVLGEIGSGVGLWSVEDVFAGL